MKPTISVLMPIYNAEVYLVWAMESVLQQTYGAWELLCLDDGSTDRSRAIVQRFARHDARVRLIALNHAGIVATLNHGVKLARGEFLARLDADDMATPSRFELQLNYLRRHPEVALVGGNYHTIQAGGSHWKTHCVPQSHAEVRAALRKSNCIAHPAVMMRRCVLEQFDGPYREWFPLAEDYDLWLRMSERCRLENLPEIVLKYRREFANPRPARTIQQAISTLAALFVHTQAKEPRGVEFTPMAPFDEPNLIAAGCPVEQIHAAVRKALLSEARATAKAGFPTQAAILVREAQKFAPRARQLRDYLDYAWKVAQVRMAA